MNDLAVHPASGESAEATLRRELARGDAMAESVLPVLRHLVAAERSSALAEDVVARVRGMIAAIAGQLAGSGQGDAEAARIRLAITDSPSLLAHLHAQAFEWHLIERLTAQQSIDPVVSPLLQSAIAHPDAETQALAMSCLAAQARWCQAQRRMTASLRELPPELLHELLQVLRSSAPELQDRAAQAESELRAGYDEGTTRLALSARLLTCLGCGNEALSPHNAGISLFLSALALRSGLARDAVTACCHDGQAARLTLALGSTGLEAERSGEVVLALHPDTMPIAGLARVDRALALSMLAPEPEHGGA